MATLSGGGKSAQVDALTHGISRALLEVDGEMRAPLKRSGLLTRDPRIRKERNMGRKAPAPSSSFPSVKNARIFSGPAPGLRLRPVSNRKGMADYLLSPFCFSFTHPDV
jgi:hypothetical protein